MATKRDIQLGLHEALLAAGGRGRLAHLARHIWEQHEAELRQSGDLFFTWQYDLRWAANRLRRKFIMKPAQDSPRGVWELA